MTKSELYLLANHGGGVGGKQWAKFPSAERRAYGTLVAPQRGFNYFAASFSFTQET